MSKLFPFILVFLFMTIIEFNQNEAEFALIFLQHAVFQRLEVIKIVPTNSLSQITGTMLFSDLI